MSEAEGTPAPVAAPVAGSFTVESALQETLKVASIILQFKLDHSILII